MLYVQPPLSYSPVSFHLCSRYQEILQTLFTTAQRRRNAHILDNICGAISRMIMACPQAVPLEQVWRVAELWQCDCLSRPVQVLPTLLQNMPLKEDMEEVSTVYSCLLRLFSTNSPVVSTLWRYSCYHIKQSSFQMMTNLPAVLCVIAQDLPTTHLSPGIIHCPPLPPALPHSSPSLLLLPLPLPLKT